MSHPDPPQVPSGPWHPREWVALVRYAQACGFERVHRSLTGDSAVWSDGTWRVEVETLRSVAEVRILHRSAGTRFECWDEKATLFVASPSELFGSLIALGVVPSPIAEVAA